MLNHEAFLWALGVLRRLMSKLSHLWWWQNSLGRCGWWTVGMCITGEARDLCECLVVGVGLGHGICQWSLVVISVSVENCRWWPVELTENEIGGIWPLETRSCITVVVTTRISEELKHQLVSLLRDYLCDQYMYLLVLIWVELLGGHACPNFSLQSALIIPNSEDIGVAYGKNIST